MNNKDILFNLLGLGAPMTLKPHVILDARYIVDNHLVQQITFGQSVYLLRTLWQGIKPAWVVTGDKELSCTLKYKTGVHYSKDL